MLPSLSTNVENVRSLTFPSGWLPGVWPVATAAPALLS